MEQALDEIAKLTRARRARSRSTGNRDYNPGWHTALDLQNLLTVSEAIARAALERKESRGGHFRDDFPEKDSDECAKVNLVVPQGGRRPMEIVATPHPARCPPT